MTRWGHDACDWIVHGMKGLLQMCITVVIDLRLHLVQTLANEEGWLQCCDWVRMAGSLNRVEG